jgi:hypothetical protein
MHTNSLLWLSQGSSVDLSLRFLFRIVRGYSSVNTSLVGNREGS